MTTLIGASLPRPDAPRVHEHLGTNQLLHVPIRKGDVAQGFAEADVVLEGEVYDLLAGAGVICPLRSFRWC
jgi:hypothetical protein